MSAGDQPQDSGRRRRRGPDRAASSAFAAPPVQPEAPFSPIGLVANDEREAVDQAALTALREIGIDVLHEGARAILRDAGAALAQARYRSAFFAPMTLDWRNSESWRAPGSPTAADAARIVADRLAAYAAPPFEPERREALEAFFARRKAEGGAPPND